MIAAYRICATKWKTSAFTGEGAKAAGGRWNSIGRPLVYCSSSLSLATLEVLVDLEDQNILARHFSFFEIQIPEEIVSVLDMERLAVDWKEDSGIAATRGLGDGWLLTMRSAVLGVPSAVTPGELNYLLDPKHPDFSRILSGPTTGFFPDPRLGN